MCMCPKDCLLTAELKYVAFHSAKCYLEETDVAFPATLDLTKNSITDLLRGVCVCVCPQAKSDPFFI